MRQFITSFTYLILVAQTSQKIFQPKQQEQQLSLILNWNPPSLSVGAIFQYCPFSEISQVGEVQRSETNQFLIYMGFDQTNSIIKLLHYVSFDEMDNSIKHTIKLNLNGGIFQFDFEMDPQKYEGIWYSQSIYYDQIQKEIFVEISSINSKAIKRISSDIFFEEEIKLIYGGSYKMNQVLLKSSENQFSQDVVFSSFPGKLKMIWLETQEIFSSFLNEKNFCDSDDFQQLMKYDHLQNEIVAKQTNKEFDSSYKLSFWVKLSSDYLQDLEFNLIDLYVTTTIDSQNQIALSSFKLQYQRIQNQLVLKIFCYSYNFPFIYSEINKNIEIKQQGFEVDESFISNWHFIEITYFRNEINFLSKSFIMDSVYLKVISQVQQFTQTKMIAQFGSNDQELNFEIAEVNYFNCFSKFIKSTTPPCHYSCFRCFGPFENQCFDCYGLSNRIFDPQTNTCKCKMWYLDVQQNTCIGHEEVNMKLTKMEIITDNFKESIGDISECQFGYFQFDGNCYPCPSASQSGIIFCVDCLMNPNTWYLTFKCENNYEQIDHSFPNVYVNRMMEFILYLLINEQVIECDYCVFCTELEYLNDIEQGNDRCFIYPEKHLNQITYIRCSESQFSYQTNKCEINFHPQIFYNKCNPTCAKCWGGECLFCIDPSKYFLNLKSRCRICNIQNCKYCFQYNQYDLNQVTVRDYMRDDEVSDNEEDFITSCSLCYKGYIFDFLINECVQLQIDPICENGYRNFNGEFICTTSNLPRSLIDPTLIVDSGGCQAQYSNCERCVNDSSNMTQCIACEEGYYLDYNNGVCMNCDLMFQNAKTCWMQTTNYDSWKYEVMSFYNNFLPDKKPILLSGAFYFQIYEILSCYEGFIPNIQICYPILDLNCLDWSIYDDYSCKLCNLFLQGLQTLTFFDSKCQICPYPCVVCYKRQSEDIASYNPYFKVYSNTQQQAYKCILNIDPDYGYINSITNSIQEIENKRGKTVQILEREVYSISDDLDDNSLNFLIIKNPITLISKYVNILPETPINLRESIFSLKNTTLIFEGQNMTLQNNITICNQTKVLVLNYKIIDAVVYSYIASQFGVEIQLNTIEINNIRSSSSIFQFQNISNLTVQNLNFQKLILTDASCFLIEEIYDDNESPTILSVNNIIFTDCIFKNSSIFSIKMRNTQQLVLYFNTIKFKNCQFLDGKIANFINVAQLKTLTIENFEFSNSIISKSTMLDVPFTFENIFNLIQMSQCQILDSILFKQSTQINLQNVILYECKLFNSSILTLSGLLKSQGFKHKIVNLQFYNVSIQASSLFSITDGDNIEETMLIQNFSLKQIFSNQALDSLKQICVLKVQCRNIQIFDILISTFTGTRVFCFKNTQKLKVTNLFLENQAFLEVSSLQQGLLIIKEFNEVTINNLNITNINQYNNPFIQIISNNEASQNQSIYISQVNLINNQLIKNQINQVTSFIQIQSEFYCKVQMDDITFLNNSVAHLIEDSQTLSPALLLVDVKQSIISLRNVQIVSCDLRNSPNSLFYLDTDQIIITNINASQINSQDALHSQSEGGVGKIIGATVLITNGQFSNIFAGKAGCFQILLLDKGLLNLQNCIFQNVQTQNTQIQQSIGGILVIDASNSILNLNFRNLQFLNVMSRDAGGCLFLTTSSIENRVDISNIIIKNILSTQLSLFGFECNDDVIICQIQLSNITIEIDSSFYQQFLEFASQNQTNLRTNTMIIISSRKILINNLIFQGILPSSGLYLAFTHYLTLNDIIVKDTTLLGQTLFLFENNFCKENYFFVTKQIRLNNILIQGTVASTLEQDSFLILKYQITNQLNVIPLKIYFNNFHLINNSCQQCIQGLVNFQFDQIVAGIRLSDLLFMNNKCGDTSCLVISQSQQLLINSILIQNGQFIQNLGFDGILKLNVQNLELQNLNFLRNSANQGGAIFMENYKISTTKHIYFLENKAIIAGAMFIKDSELDQSNLQSIYFFENVGILQVKNVQEEPQNLMMSIFNSDIETISSNYIGIPNLQKYQNQNFLYLPSGQKIESYKIFNQKELNYQNYDLNLKFYMISILGEKLNYIPDSSSQCKLNIIQVNGKTQTTVYQNNILKFDAEESTVTFSDIILILDPYSINSSNQTLQIECDFSSQKKLLYEFNVKGFKCQMGEYYFESQCLECDSTKGYYSFEPKSSICLKVDPVSIAQNTANQIELNQGFWRPTVKSSNIVQCQKNTNSCQGGWAVGDNSCKIGYLGGMCEVCDIYNTRGLGQYFQNSNFRCQLCENYTGRIIILLLVTLLTLYSTYLTINSAQIIFLYFRRLKYITFHYRIIFRLGLDQSAALIKMIVNYFQILNAINQFQLDTYENIFGLLNPFSNPVGASLYSFDCFFSQQSSIAIIYVSLIVNIFGPIFYYLLFVTIYLLIIFMKKIQLSVTIYLTAFFYLLFYTQPSIFKELGGLAAQRSIASIIYINQNVQYLYYTKTHITWLTFFIIPMLLFLGIVLPIIIFYILFKNRKYFNSEKVRKLWGYLFNDYQEKTFYWEIIRIFQRQIIILALTFYQEQIIIKGCFIIIILILYYSMVLYFKPYNIQSLNIFELQSISICGIIIALSCLKYTTQQSKMIIVDHILSFLFLGVFLYFLFSTLAKLIQIYYSKYAERFNNLKLIIFKNFPQLIVICPRLKAALRQKNKQIILQRFQIAFILLKNLKHHTSKVQNQSLQIRPTLHNEHSQLSVQFNLIENQDRNLSLKLSEQQAQLF